MLTPINVTLHTEGVRSLITIVEVMVWNLKNKRKLDQNQFSGLNPFFMATLEHQKKKVSMVSFLTMEKMNLIKVTLMKLWNTI